MHFINSILREKYQLLPEEGNCSDWKLMRNDATAVTFWKQFYVMSVVMLLPFHRWSKFARKLVSRHGCTSIGNSLELSKYALTWISVSLSLLCLCLIEQTKEDSVRQENFVCGLQPWFSDCKVQGSSILSLLKKSHPCFEVGHLQIQAQKMANCCPKCFTFLPKPKGSHKPTGLQHRI